MDDRLTIIYASAHKAPQIFLEFIFQNLLDNSGDYPIVALHTTPQESSITNYYTELVEAAKHIDTPYIAFAEDDTLYPDEHFNYRPPLDTFAYNFTRWNLNVKDNPAYFSLRQRKILATLIAPRELFIHVMEARLLLSESQMVEPGRRNGEQFQIFNTYNPIVVFQHPTSFAGTNKRANRIRATAIPMWGSAEELKAHYV